MKILSISDVITNSSSEVFCMFDEDSDKRLWNLLSCILETFEIKEPVNEVFNISYELSFSAEEDNIKDAKEALKERCGYNGQPYITQYVITAKDPKYDKLCRVLSNLDCLFDYEEVYN